MAEDFIRIEIKDLDLIQKAIKRMPNEAAAAFTAAANEAGNKVLNQEGLRLYPPATASNAPPIPYYIRGRGMQTSESRNDLGSERLGTQFYIRSIPLGAEIGNRASYAGRVIGENQGFFFSMVGWRKLGDVAFQQLPEITKIYNAWMKRMLEKTGLKTD